jgi:mono/diheme cytochrome c family protein
LRIVPSKLWTAGAFVFALAVATIICEEPSSGESAGVSWVAPARANRISNPVSADSASIRAGHAVYCDQCLSCHGSGAKGDGPSGGDLQPRPDDLTTSALRSESDGALYWKITNGRDPMPGFDTMIVAKDRWNVVNYLRTLEPKATTSPSSRQSADASGN